VLNSEGLTGFVNASYGFGRPGTDQLRAFDYHNALDRGRSGPELSGDPHAREEPDVTGLGFMTDDEALGGFPTRDGCAVSASRPTLTGPTAPRHQSGQLHLQPGH